MAKICKLTATVRLVRPVGTVFVPVALPVERDTLGVVDATVLLNGAVREAGHAIRLKDKAVGASAAERGAVHRNQAEMGTATIVFTTRVGQFCQNKKKRK